MTQAEYIKKLERALRFYANKRHWKKDDWGILSVIQPPEYGNPGEKARAALAKPFGPLRHYWKRGPRP
jgi:hypothetical protein